MLCEKCGKHTATTHIKTIINGVMTEKFLCGYCANEVGFELNNNNSLSGMLASMLNEMGMSVQEKEKRCPVCGCTFSKIAETGKAGCADCYNTFKSELLPYLKRVHGSTKHIGKSPDTKTPKVDLKSEDTVSQLRAQLDCLINEEKYEEAAVIRDKIRMMEAQNNG